MNSNDTSLDQIGTCSNKVRVSGNSRKNIVGVTKRKSGKYAVKVYDRIRKKDLWLGTFDTEEEASVVYLSKKTELEEELHASVIKAVGKRTSKYVGVWRRDSGKFAAHIRDPIRKKKLYLGTFVSEEEAAEAYLAKKAELAEEVKGKGIRWFPERECRKSKSMCLKITKNDELEQCMEDNAMDIEDNSIDPSCTGVFQENSPCFENNQEPSKESDSLDSCIGETASSNAVPDKKLPVVEQTSMDSEVSKENTPIQKDGGSTEKELIVVESNAGSLINTGPQILLRTMSGTPVMDSNGCLLGEWRWIDDLSLPIDM
jgi:hypothetical protein